MSIGWLLVASGLQLKLRRWQARGSASEMTYIVSSGALNSTHSLTSSLPTATNVAN